MLSYAIGTATTRRCSPASAGTGTGFGRRFRPRFAVRASPDDSFPNPATKGFFDANQTSSDSGKETVEETEAPRSALEPSGSRSIDVDALVEELSDTSQLGERGEVYFVLQAVLLLLVVFPAKGISDFITTAGFFCFLGGIGMIAWSANELGDSLSPLPKPRSNAELCRSGPYEYVRHPMYCALLLSCVGLGIATSSATRVVLSLALLLLLDTKASKEEAFLVERFGDDYTSYQQSVKKLIPWLY
jgi:protein-S-isoprenylcysteine O-methyltransferase Ste14